MASSNDMCGKEIWLTAAFRTARADEKFIFMKKECALYKYDSGEAILRQPTQIGKVWPSLKCTIFVDAGIDCTFGSNNSNNAFIFSYGQCAEFDYAPNGGDDKIVRGPMSISKMFPYFKGTAFEEGVDAAFESMNRQEAYLFKGNMCARIAHAAPNPKLISMGLISDMFPILKGTIFASGFDAAFTFTYQSYQSAVLFKKDTMCHLHFTPGSITGQVKWGPNKIKDVKKVLGSILPRKNTDANLIPN